MKHNLCCYRNCTWFFWAGGGPPPCVLQSSRPSGYKGEHLLFCARPRQPAKACQLACCSSKGKQQSLIPQHSFRQTLLLFTHIHLPRRKKKKIGGENSLLNPNTNTILIHIHVLYLLTCMAYNGGYHLGYCVPGKAQSHQRKR